jgi:hypothetical protein
MADAPKAHLSKVGWSSLVKYAKAERCEVRRDEAESGPESSGLAFNKNKNKII